ncbi:MAG TPA: UDP-galactopyranose mutase, partial [Candidatus Limnocylindria bacterium]|nr:UDP-galactopyranose mutase [Candidatus Limnocylindria bacterium]
IPINLDTINSLYGLNLDSFQLDAWFASRAEKKEICKTSEDVVVNKVGRELYEKFFRGYTRKQWGLDPSELDAQVTARVPTRTNRDSRYFTDAYQAMPKFGYTRLFERMLDHPNIKVMLNADYREVKNFVPYQELIFSGPVDEFFDFRFGKLPYRCLEFKHETVNKEWVQPVAVINYPNDYAYTRVTEFKHLTGQEHQKSSLVYEFSCAEGDPYYPIPRGENAELYKRYAALAEQTPHVHFVGRLATYKYYNMDQVVAQALTTFAKIVGLPRQEAVALKAEPRITTIHVPLNGELVPLEGNGNGHAIKNGNGHAKRRGRASVSEILGANGNGNGNGHTWHNGKSGSLLGHGNGNGNGNGNGH